MIETKLYRLKTSLSCIECGGAILPKEYATRLDDDDRSTTCCLSCYAKLEPSALLPDPCGDCGRRNSDVQYYSFGPDCGPGWKNQNGGDCCSSCYDKLHRAEAEKAWAEYEKDPWVIG
jgi:hypothetical protein